MVLLHVYNLKLIKLIERGWATLAKSIPQESYISPTVIIPPGISNSSPQAGLDPDVIVIKLGTNDTVYWLNKDLVPLTLAAKDGSWSTSIIKPGETANVKFDHIGLYEYSSKEYPWASGQIVVLGSDVESLDLKEKLKIAQALLSREMGQGFPLVELGFNVDNSLHVGILKSELEKNPDAGEYYAQKYSDMLPFDVSLKIEFVEQSSPS